MSTQNTNPLPPEPKMSRDDALRAFVAVANTCQIEHPDYGTDAYPISTENVDFGSTRSYHARCGPRYGYTTKVSYSTRMTYINRVDRPRHLALLTHEVCHIKVGRHSNVQSGTHPPRFWQEMAFAATEVRDALESGELSDIFGDVDIDDYLQAVVDDPNSSTVDRRYQTVDDVRETVAELIGRPDLHDGN